jgi:hypothetical protein
MLGHFFLAIDIEHFIPLELKRITGEIMRSLQTARKAPGQERIYVAGEKEYETERLVREQGIPVNRQLLRDLQAMRDEMGISGFKIPFLARACLDLHKARVSWKLTIYPVGLAQKLASKPIFRTFQTEQRARLI